MNLTSHVNFLTTFFTPNPRTLGINVNNKVVEITILMISTIKITCADA